MPRALVPDQTSGPVGDDLRLPNPPGVIRRFWARHPRITDVLIVLLAIFLSLPQLLSTSSERNPLVPDATTDAERWAFGAGIIVCVALMWRRRWPVQVFVITLVPVLLFAWTAFPAGFTASSVFALGSVAIYRTTRATWGWFASACGALAFGAAVHGALAGPTDLWAWTTAIPSIFFLLLGALIGINLGSRHRYVLALIDRSRQLLVERDQQARLAAIAERTRIAREMHDIVSHSLTVIVALSEGAAATSDAERSREASRASAATAREALSEMRVMLGVLRDDESGAAVPLAPMLDASLHDVVDAARKAGFPVGLTIEGAPDAAATTRLAILRVVQEGLTNAMRYSRDASYFRVLVAYRESGVIVEVENDGAHADERSLGSGVGLAGLRERVAHLGGTLEAGMTAPQIWRLRAVLHEGPIDV